MKHILPFLLFPLALNSQHISVCYQGDLAITRALPQITPTECVEISYVAVCDYQFYADNNRDINAIQNLIVDVVARVNEQYATSFQKQIILRLDDIKINTTPQQDEWEVNGDDLYNRIATFNSWVNGSTYSGADLVSLWTGDDLNGSVIGLAYTGQVCGAYAVNVLEYFSTSASWLSLLATHEIGHNFSAMHDNGSGYMMSPYVNNGGWSPASIASINNYVNGMGCGENCATVNPDTCFGSVTIIDTIRDTVRLVDVTWIFDTIRDVYIQKDTITAYYYDTLFYVVVINDTVYVYDTIYITDTIDVITGIDEATKPLNNVVVTGIFDILGREVHAIRNDGYYLINGKVYYIGF